MACIHPTRSNKDLWASGMVMGLWMGLGCLTSLQAETSKLWGEGGEAWEIAGPLPDFSFAGYQRGESPLPERPSEVDARDFGVVGDGKTDDTKALQAALRASEGKVLQLPEGRFLLTDFLEIQSSGTVLRGAGPKKTTFVCPKPLERIRPQPLRNMNPDTAYSWSGGIVRVAAPTFGFRRLTDAEPGAAAGARHFEVEDAGRLNVGDEVLLAVTDDEEHSLLRHVYADDPGDLSRVRKGTTFRQGLRILAIEGSTVTVDRPLRYPLRAEWQPEIRRFDPQVRESGVESLGFEFPASDYGGHFSELGFNAIELDNVSHCWVRDVHIANADSGIYLDRSMFCTVEGVTLDSARKPDERDRCTGHHGIQIIGEDSLVTGFTFRTRFIHDITVQNAVGNVFSHGSGVDLALDHHRHAPHANLFSNLDAGLGDRLFRSGGARGSGHHSAADTTLWNVRTQNPLSWPDDFGPDRMNWIGVRTEEPDSSEPEGRWIEVLNPESLQPADLHQAQLKKRLGSSD